MDRKTKVILTVVLASLLCGLPGLAGLCLGPLAVLGSLLPDSTVNPDDTGLVIGMGITILCTGIIFITVPFVVGFRMVRGTKPKPDDFNEPIPADDF